MLILLALACAQQAPDDTATTDLAEDTGGGPLVESESYACADGGNVTHTHPFGLVVGAADDLDLSTVYDDAYRAHLEELTGYEAPKMTIGDDVAFDAQGRVLVVCEWADDDDYVGRVQTSYTLVVRH